MRAITVFLAICLGMLFFAETNLSSLLVYHDKSGIRSAAITRETPVRGEFIAREDNLAIVKLRMRTGNRLNTSHITFSLRPKGAADWTVINQYAVDRFADGLLYPFGFPAIPNSRGKTYEFALSTGDAIPGNTVSVDTGYHGVATQYVFTKSKVTQNIFPFLQKKLFTLLEPYWLLYLLMIVLPVFPKAALFLSFVILTYLPLSIHPNFMAFFVPYATVLGRLTAKGVFAVGLFFIAQIPLTVFFGNLLAANRAATLVFFLMLTGGIMWVVALQKK